MFRITFLMSLEFDKSNFCMFLELIYNERPIYLSFWWDWTRNWMSGKVLDTYKEGSSMRIFCLRDLRWSTSEKYVMHFILKIQNTHAFRYLNVYCRFLVVWYNTTTRRKKRVRWDFNDYYCYFSFGSLKLT